MFADFASVGLKSHKTGSAAKRIGPVVHLLVSSTHDLCSNPGHQSKGHHVPLRWCGSWGSSPVLGTATRGGSTLLFWWCWLVKSRATNHGNSRRSLCIAAAILIGRWQMRCLWKAHDPRNRLVWSAAGRAANNVADMAASLVSSNLRRDSKAAGRAK